MTEAICNERSTVSGNQLFTPGQVVMTNGIAAEFQSDPLTPNRLLTRHLAGDWGDLDEEDTEANNNALKMGGRLFSSYVVDPDNPGFRVWIITEADRSATTLLLPSEY